jgi:hypothetical protein
MNKHDYFKKGLHVLFLVLLTETWHFPNQQLPHVEGFDSLAVARTVQLGRTKAIKHSGGVVVYFRSHLNPNLS